METRHIDGKPVICNGQCDEFTELLAALKRALRLLDGSPYNYLNSDKVEFEAAIARAEGRE